MSIHCGVRSFSFTSNYAPRCLFRIEVKACRELPVRQVIKVMAGCAQSRYVLRSEVPFNCVAYAEFAQAAVSVFVRVYVSSLP